MPNWCSTAYSFLGDKKEIKALYHIMKNLESMKEPLVKNGFGSNWLGCLVTALKGDWEKIRCRGCWENLELIGDEQLNFSTESAWCPCDETMDLICEKFPSLSYYYIAEEPGCGIYETNDSTGEFFPDRFTIDICSPDEDYYTEYFISEEGMFKWFSETFNMDINSMGDIGKLSDKWEEENPDSYCWVHEFRIVD